MYTKRKKNYERHNVWRSYSDMLSGLLLLFILVMCISFMQAQKNYQDRLAEEAAHQLTQEQLMAELQIRENQVASQQSAIDEQNALLASQQADLNSKDSLLASKQQDLDAKSLLVTQQQIQIDEKNAALARQQAALDEQANQMAIQQQKIEQIIGVKADLISALKQQFDANHLNVTLDKTDGSIILDSNVLFGYNEDVLTEEGNMMLDEVLPIYCQVLLDPQYDEYLAEIRIDGYTDTDGDYLYNLKLSQQRALAVANFLIDRASYRLSQEELTALKGKLTANGHSMSNPVFYEDGTVNMEASRRVEIKFSLKDEEMINEMRAILDNAQNNG